VPEPIVIWPKPYLPLNDRVRSSPALASILAESTSETIEDELRLN
jgi:hypothetical protein